MADLTRFDFHVVRFMNSEDVETMTAEEVGQYLLLLCKAWLLQKDATLPDDPKYLATVARVTKVSPLVLKKFPVVETSDGPRRRNQTLYGEWMVTKERSESGRTAVEQRWEKQRNTNLIRPYNEGTTHTNPIRTIPNQTNSIEFAGGSFGQGNFKFISGRWYGHFKKTLQKSKQNKEQYSQACSTYGEDRILEYLETWAAENQWVAAHPKGGNRLYVFLQTLPEMIEGDQFREDRQKDRQKNEIPPEEIESLMLADRSARDAHVKEELKKIKEEEKQAAATRYEI